MGSLLVKARIRSPSPAAFACRMPGVVSAGEGWCWPIGALAQIEVSVDSF
jgi:hypothetical protein